MKFTNCVTLVGSKPKRYEGIKRYVSTGALAVDHIDEESVELVGYEDRPSRADLTAEAGDVLFAKMADTKKTLLLDKKTAENIYSTGFFAVRAKPGMITAECLYYLLTSDVFLRQKNKHSSGATQRAITNKGLEAIDISIPNLDEQTRLVAKLDALSRVIKSREQQLVELDNLIKARFVELFGGGETPIKTVEELCETIVDCPHTTPKYEGELKNPAIRTSEIKKGYIMWESMRYVSDEEYEERTARLKPKAGDIVYGREGTFGNAAILPEGHNFCLGQRVMLLRPDYSKCTSEYLLHAVISDDVYRQAVEKNNASTVAHVNVKDVKQFRIPLPSLDKQNQFASFVEQTDKSKVVEM